MAENDAYNSKVKYDSFVKNYKDFLLKPSNPDSSKFNRKYFCKNPENLNYFIKLFELFELRDNAYVRRMRVLSVFKIICHVATKNLKDCDRDDINEIMRFMHHTRPSPRSKKDFVLDLKHIWKNLFPDKDPQGRIDDTVTPYVVRHLSSKIDKSREKRRNDKLTFEEFTNLVKAFNGDVRLQAFITLAHESLGRPQEILYTRIRDVEVYDNYMKIWISEHGKEGTGFLQCVDSYPYVSEWFNQHPLKHDPDAFLFINLGDFGKYRQLTPPTINKHLRNKLKLLKIQKRITCYSFKRNGVTYRRLRGDSDTTIQHTARWTSTKQLKTYDYSEQEETFKIELAKRGLIKDKNLKQFRPMSKECIFCQKVNGIGDDICKSCKRPLDRKKILEQVENAQKVSVQERDEQKEHIDYLHSVIFEMAKDNPRLARILEKRKMAKIS